MLHVVENWNAICIKILFYSAKRDMGCTVFVVVQFFPSSKFLNQFNFDFPLFQIVIMNNNNFIIMRQRQVDIELV